MPGGVARLDPTIAQAVEQLDLPSDITALHVLPDGDLVTGHLDGRVRVWSPEDARAWAP